MQTGATYRKDYFKHQGLSKFEVLDLGLIDYRKALAIQKELVKEIHLSKKQSTLIFCEHNTVITLGRSASINNIIKREEIKKLKIGIYNSPRGGDVTIHMPKQLVAYPIFDLRIFGRDIHGYLRKLELAIIYMLKDYGINGIRNEKYTGVWVKDEKIASIGIAINHWITSHGLSVNVDCDLNLFSLIKPCGQDTIITSISKIINKQNDIDIQEAKKRLIAGFLRVFQT